jgi:hypothetical protein
MAIGRGATNADHRASGRSRAVGFNRICPGAGALAFGPEPPLAAKITARLLNSHWIYTMYRCALAAVAAVCLVSSAAAQSQRNFPQNALRGTLQIASPSDALLNGKPARLAPGLRIRGQNNMLQMSGGLIGAKLLVHYTTDIDGLVKDVWVLTPAEAAKKPWPVTAQQSQAWTFDPIAQTWDKP